MKEMILLLSNHLVRCLSRLAKAVPSGSKGFSLVNLIMGIGLISFVAMTAAYISAQTKKTGVEGESLFSLNQDHLLALQKSKSISAMKTALGITATSPSGQCFAGRGTGCSSLAVTSWAPVPGFASSRVDPGGRTIATTGDYKLECAAATSCESLVIKVESTLTMGATQLYRRQSEVRLGGMFLSDRRVIDFSCVASTGHLLTAMNLKTLRGECLPLPPAAACPSQRPLTLYRVGASPGCQPATSLSCGTGFRQVGILNGQGSCI